MLNEGVQIIPECKNMDPESLEIINEYYVDNVFNIIKLYYEYLCTKNENGNYCPLNPEDDQNYLKDICKSNICRKKFTNYLIAFLEKQYGFQNDNNNDIEFNKLRETLKILKSEDCLKGTIEIENYEDNSSNIKYIVLGAVGTGAICM
ncbi:hypothetical protein PIROE2DRAFT_64787 [Piromyces sp. E2]|nr:hypothetical protein PIROE2DRAFT_64787 [Piromyces sp. E2]|eukprot:OUM57816.1 hypothetical protein PIROE2DRAFT_64787 [Piromyces sp. E2]